MLKCHVGDDIVKFRPAPAPTMELDILLVTDMRTLHSILKDLDKMNFKKESLQF